MVLAVVMAPRGHKRLLGIVSDTLERASRPHVVSLVEGGVAALLMTRDAADLIDVLDRALHGVGNVAIGVSGPIPPTTAARGVVPAGLAAAAARRGQRRIGWFDDLTLSAVLADEAVRSRVWTLARPAWTLWCVTRPREKRTWWRRWRPSCITTGRGKQPLARWACTGTRCARASPG